MADRLLLLVNRNQSESLEKGLPMAPKHLSSLDRTAVAWEPSLHRPAVLNLSHFQKREQIAGLLPDQTEPNGINAVRRLVSVRIRNHDATKTPSPKDATHANNTSHGRVLTVLRSTASSRRKRQLPDVPCL